MQSFTGTRKTNGTTRTLKRRILKLVSRCCCTIRLSNYLWKTWGQGGQSFRVIVGFYENTKLYMDKEKNDITSTLKQRILKLVSKCCCPILISNYFRQSWGRKYGKTWFFWCYVFILVKCDTLHVYWPLKFFWHEFRDMLKHFLIVNFLHHFVTCSMKCQNEYAYHILTPFSPVMNYTHYSPCL